MPRKFTTIDIEKENKGIAISSLQEVIANQIERQLEMEERRILESCCYGKAGVKEKNAMIDSLLGNKEDPHRAKQLKADFLKSIDNIKKDKMPSQGILAEKYKEKLLEKTKEKTKEKAKNIGASLTTTPEGGNSLKTKTQKKPKTRLFGFG